MKLVGLSDVETSFLDFEHGGGDEGGSTNLSFSGLRGEHACSGCPLMKASQAQKHEMLSNSLPVRPPTSQNLKQEFVALRHENC